VEITVEAERIRIVCRWPMDQVAYGFHADLPLVSGKESIQ